MISFVQRQGTVHRNRQMRADMLQLLARAKAIMSRWERLHSMSVMIGKMEKISDSGVIEAEISGCRALVEQADRLCADIDRMTLLGGVENVSITGRRDGGDDRIMAVENAQSQQG